jgi:AcrR family transcriptional regulator
MALRDPDKTRTNIVDVAAAMFSQKGFKGTSLSDILNEAQISKGALYHHFSNKQELLYAVFDESYQVKFLMRWNNIVISDDPINEIANVVEGLSVEGSDEEMCSGCPVNNIASELASTDENIRKRVDNLFCQIQKIISQGIDKAKKNGDVNSTVDSKKVSLFFMCTMSGIPQMVKSCQDREIFTQLTSALSDYVKQLKLI